MILISHRGNVSGIDQDNENNPKYINAAIKKGFEVEIDVQFENGEFKVKYGAEKFNNRDITFGWMGDRPSAARIIVIGIEGENIDKEQILKKSLSGFVYSRRKNKDEDFKLENVVLFSTLPEYDMNQIKGQ